MANFLSNPLVILFAAAVIIVSLMFLFVGRKKKDKKKKVEKAIQPKTTEEKTQESNSEMPSEQKQSEEEKVQVSDDFIENPEANSGNSNEKRVSKVYIRKSKESSNLQEDENLEEKKYNDLSDKAEFVKTSKTISKFSGFNKIEQTTEDFNQIKERVEQEIADCEVCEEVRSRIDHSRRLSKSIKNDDFDSLFASHLTEHYLNIDFERHLSSTKTNDDLFNRTNEMLKNGETRALDSESQNIYNSLKTNKEKLQFWFNSQKANQNNSFAFDEMMEKIEYNDSEYNEFSFTLKDLMIAESLLRKRKKIKK